MSEFDITEPDDDIEVEEGLSRSEVSEAIEAPVVDNEPDEPATITVEDLLAEYEAEHGEITEDEVAEYVAEFYPGDDDAEVEDLGEAHLALAVARDVDDGEPCYVLRDRDGNEVDRFRVDSPFGFVLEAGQYLELEA